MFYNFSIFAKPSMDFIQLWHDYRALSKILCSTIPIPVHDLKIKVTDFEFSCVKSLQCQLLQSLWLIWIVFGMNGCKILKCFRKEKRVSGELPCPATGVIIFRIKCWNSYDFHSHPLFLAILTANSITHSLTLHSNYQCGNSFNWKWN